MITPARESIESKRSAQIDNSALQLLLSELLGKHQERFLSACQPCHPGTYGVKARKRPAKKKLEAQILDCFGSNRFCRQRPNEPESFLALIRDCIAAEKPIPIIIGHGPLKNRNNCGYSLADWAEWFTLSQLTHLQLAVREIYTPGITVTFYVDDARAAAANQVPDEWMASYLQSLRRLVEMTGQSDWIQGVFALSDLYTVYAVLDYLPQAEALVIDWERNPANQNERQLHLEHALRNKPQFSHANCDTVLTPENALPSEIREAEAAAHRYRVYYQAEVLSGLWSQPDKLYARYSPHAGFWQLFTLRRGSVTQPWQGQGCLLLNSCGKLEPFLMTRSRKAEYELIATLETGMNHPGFEQVDVYVARTMPANSLSTTALSAANALL